eukprot:5281536-Prorocentrum_lima.AAC.1
MASYGLGNLLDIGVWRTRATDKRKIKVSMCMAITDDFTEQDLIDVTIYTKAVGEFLIGAFEV